MSAFANIIVGGVFHAAVLFLVAAGLQLVFGVQKIVNLACGSFYALGAYFGVSFVAYASAAAIATAAGFGAFLQRTNYGRILRATAENRAMAEALGVDVRRLYAVVFTIGTVLGTTAGALVVPTAAASLDMAIDFVIEAFAVVVIGGLGSMRGALAGALIVGLIRAFAIVVYPEAEVLAIYVIVIAVLLLRPAGLFGKQAS